MAMAGFIYNPDPEGGVDDDTASCLYCDLELGGWEPSDDPMYVAILVTGITC